MPFINISTSAKVDDETKLLKEFVSLISSLTKKSEKFVMAKVDDGSKIFFQDESPCCYVELKSIGSLSPAEITKPICNFINSSLEIPLDKIYICFEDVPASMWGWNGRTFG